EQRFGVSWFLPKAESFRAGNLTTRWRPGVPARRDGRDARPPSHLRESRSYCSTTWSPSFRPLRSSVLAPLEMPILTAIFFLPSLALVSGISTDAFLSLS